MATRSTPPKRGLSQKELLGKRLFEDATLSEPAGQSCATCHAASVAFTDPDATHPTSKGVRPGLFGNRNTPMASYMMFAPDFHYDEAEGLYVGGQFLDGRAATLELQAQQPFLNPVEMANPNRESVVNKVKHGRERGAVPATVRQRCVRRRRRRLRRGSPRPSPPSSAPQAFAPFTSKFDYYVKGQAQLTAQEQHGLELFNATDKGNCAACHPSTSADGTTPALFTDFTYDNLGVARRQGCAIALSVNR